jgi:hypothetical protein
MKRETAITKNAREAKRRDRIGSGLFFIRYTPTLLRAHADNENMDHYENCHL